MNGSEVERLYLDSGESCIWKPLTNDGQLGTEAWVYEHVLAALPPIYPRLLARSSPSAPGMSWTLFEDLGPLDHAFAEETALALMSQIARWHALPTDTLREAPLRGPKPAIRRMAADIQSRAEPLPGIPGDLVRQAAEMTRQPAWAEEVSNASVFSHGDLHLGNYAMTAEGIKVLDWEHAHLNHPYWDLYHVLDMSHPLFPKPVDAAIRGRALERYMAETARIGALALAPSFKRGYSRFAAVFSLWMLQLIDSDLRAGGGPWPLDRLRQQRREARTSFEQCAAACADMNEG
ncbi:phosphotransferase [Cohnella nanjingensis]|uniref:Phosphotransferase n=2 Tax=Cohnella nanjingensis TaxID=1387779 RepID=A0A7X0VIQ8_9BACL|nr:phosphotransferase [Cohnella nanjingensis]